MSEDLNKLRERLDLYAKDSARPLPSWACQAMKEASAAISRLQAAEERAEKVEGALKRARPYVADLPIVGDEDLALIDAALKTEA